MTQKPEDKVADDLRDAIVSLIGSKVALELLLTMDTEKKLAGLEGDFQQVIDTIGGTLEHVQKALESHNKAQSLAATLISTLETLEIVTTAPAGTQFR
jgi:hypothetical protein